MIECITLYGDKKLVAKDKLSFRPGAYAIIINQGKILLLKMRHTGKYFFPGGGVEIGETMATALKREVKEETGLDIEIKQFFHFKESFFYYNPRAEAYHTLLFFYLCQAKILELIDDDQVVDDEAEQPRWVELETVNENNFQPSIYDVFELIKNQLVSL